MAAGTDTIAEVARRLAAGETGTSSFDAAAERVVRGIEPVARRTCRACLPGANEAQVEDAVQDTLLVAWRRFPEFAETLDGEDNRAVLARWVKQISRFTCANLRRRRADTLLADGVVDAADPALGPLAWLTRKERDELLLDVLQSTLPELEQDVVYHRYVHDLERAEIARLLGLPDADAVRVRLQAALRKLKPALARRAAELAASWSDGHEDFVG